MKKKKKEKKKKEKEEEEEEEEEETILTSCMHIHVNIFFNEFMSIYVNDVMGNRKKSDQL